MSRFRRVVLRFFRLSGPVIGLVTVVCVGGLGLHAARDWHRHGELGAGFFHLHFNVGHHDHDHPGRDDHDRDAPADPNRRATAVLAIAQALHNDAAAAVVAAPGKPAPDRLPIDGVVLPRSTEYSFRANPRAPPA